MSATSNEAYYPVRFIDIYPGISPEKFKGVHTGKVVFITGGATGLGLAAAKAFVNSGANVFIVGRRLEKLEKAKAEIVALGGEVGVAAVDVTNDASVKAGVAACIQKFGKIDIVIANAGRTTDVDRKIADFDVEDWWTCIEASVKGSFLTVHATIPELVKTKGYIVLLSSGLAQLRIPGGSSYNIAKHSINRLAEWIDLEYGKEGVKAFSVHPGTVATELSELIAATTLKSMEFNHTPELSAYTYVRMTSGSEDWMSGRYYDVTWGLDNIGDLKNKIIEQDAFKNRLLLPE